MTEQAGGAPTRDAGPTALRFARTPWEPPRAVTPDRVALAGIVAFAALVTPQYLFCFDALSAIEPTVASRLVIVAVTSALAACVGALSIRCATTPGARAAMTLGGALAGAANTWVCIGAASLVAGRAVVDLSRHAFEATVSGLILGFLYGAALSPVVRAAVRARVAPSVDAVDRVLFAASAVTLVACALLAPLARDSSHPATSMAAPRSELPFAFWIAVCAGAVGVAVAALRLCRLEIVELRARSGVDVQFEIVARGDHPDEAALLPLTVTPAPCDGVLVRRGASTPHRGERGAVKLALVSIGHPRTWLQRLVMPIVVEGAGVVGVLAAGIVPIVLLLACAAFASTGDLGQR